MVSAIRTAVLFLALAIAAMAQTVLVTPKGKTYHNNPKCMALSHSGEVHRVTEQAAIEHGLKPCRICHRQRRPKSEPGTPWWKENQ